MRLIREVMFEEEKAQLYSNDADAKIPNKCMEKLYTGMEPSSTCSYAQTKKRKQEMCKKA